jgi:cytochrome c biogenesis protein CcdA
VSATANERTASDAALADGRRSGAVVLALGIALGLLLVAANGALYSVEGRVSDAASLLPVGYAFAAGMVATVNPCGVLLLPSLVAYYLGQGAAPAAGWSRAVRSLVLALTATLGFVAIFAAVGLVVGAGGQALGSAFPVGGLLVGVGLILLGAWLALSGRELGLLSAGRAMGRVRLGQDPGSMFLFGVAYAVASLACTLPVFLVVVGSALAAGGIVAGTAQFVGYALGMGFVFTVVILAAAFFQSLVTRSVRRLVPYVHRASAGFLVGAGIFLIHYWLSSA